MDRLILLRHGKAEAHSTSGEDFDRSLAPRGVLEAAAMGERLARKGFRPDLVLVSASARTRETWAAVAPAFTPAQVRYEDDLFHAEAHEVARIAAEAGEGFATVMVVGHNPGLHELAVALMLRAEAPDKMLSDGQRGFPPASAAVFDLSAAKPVADAYFVPERAK